MSAASRPDPASTGYFGKPGSFSHEVALRRFPGAPLLPFEQMSGAFDALRDGTCERAVVPFENSIGGAVPDTLDQLVLMRDWEKQFAILEQLVFAVRLCLMRRPDATRLERVYSHFVPLQVVRPWLAKHHPGTDTIESASTSSAALAASKDAGGAAVGNEAAADVYGLKVVARDLASSSLNVTRFLVVGPRTGTRADRTIRHPARAMVHLQLKHQPGALADVLVLLKRRNVNLTQLLSRPVQGRLGQHRFLIELDLPRDPKVTARLWPALERITTAMHLLGEYPVAKVR